MWIHRLQGCDDTFEPRILQLLLQHVRPNVYRPSANDAKLTLYDPHYSRMTGPTLLVISNFVEDRKRGDDQSGLKGTTLETGPRADELAPVQIPPLRSRTKQCRLFALIARCRYL